MIFDIDTPVSKRVTDTARRSADAIVRANEVRQTLTDASLRNFGKITMGVVRHAERAGTIAGQGILRLAERKAPAVDAHEEFRSRLAAFEQAVQQMGPEIVKPGTDGEPHDYSLGIALGLRWAEIAKTEPAPEYGVEKSDVEYVNDFAYVLQASNIHEGHIQQVVIGLHDHILENGGTMSLPGEREPQLSPHRS